MTDVRKPNWGRRKRKRKSRQVDVADAEDGNVELRIWRKQKKQYYAKYMYT